MVASKSKQNFTEGPIFRRLLVFTLPIIATSLLAVFYNMADYIVVGRFSGDDSALAAIGQTSSFNSLMSNIIIGISAGAGVVVAQLFGAKRREELSRSIHTSMVISIVMGVALMAIGILMSRTILSVIISPENHAILLDKATLYVIIVSLGVPAASVYNFGASILRSLGDSRTPLIIGVASGFLNVGLNLVLVIFFHMSIVGVAIATIASQYLSAIAVVFLLIRRDDDAALVLKKLSIDLGLMRRILYCGIPAAIQSSIFSVANMMLASAVGTLPVTTISANTIAGNIDSISYQCMNGFATSVTTFVGQNYGAMKEGRIWRSFGAALIQVAAVGILMAIVELSFAEELCSLFVSEDAEAREETIRQAVSIMWRMLVPYVLCGIMGVLGGFLRGLGFSIQPMIATVSCVLIVRVTWIYVFFPLNHTIEWLYVCYPLTWIATALIESVMIYFAGKHIKKLAKQSGTTNSEIVEKTA